MLEIGFVAGDERNLIFEGGGSDSGITQLHRLLLAQFDRLFNNLMIECISKTGIDETTNRSLLP